MVLKKHEIEAALHAEAQAISTGKLKEDNPLDLSESFGIFCEACRRGDLKVCQEKITEGVNISARDKFDYTPLILASLCGHYEVVQLLLDSGALCERDTFQGERCLYNALNDRIHNLLLSYDYVKSTNPLQPLAAHITSLLTLEHPKIGDITLMTSTEAFHLHKFLLSVRSPYFAKKLAAAPETTSWKLSNDIPIQSFQIALRHLYLSEVSADLGNGEEEQAIRTGIDKISRQLEIDCLFESILEGGDRRLIRQRRKEEINRGRDQLNAWFQDNILANKVTIDTDKANTVCWDRNNNIFADVLLRADDEPTDDDDDNAPAEPTVRSTPGPLNGIPIGPLAKSRSPSRHRAPRKSTLYPAHRAMLLRSEYFLTMFSSAFREAQPTPHLQIITLDCTPAVLEVVLTFLYTERADFGLDIAIEVLFAADALFIEKLKQRAAVIISTLGNGSTSAVEAVNPRGETDAEDVLDVYEVVRAGWDTRVHRLEEFGARYIAYRLERYIDEEEFAELVRESAARIVGRQETDTVELIDDIRYYLSERFRLRFEGSGIDKMMDGGADGGTGQPMHASDRSFAAPSLQEDEGVDVPSGSPPKDGPDAYAPDMLGGAVRTLEGKLAGDESAQDAINYQILLGKIDRLLERLKLDA